MNISKVTSVILLLVIFPWINTSLAQESKLSVLDLVSFEQPSSPTLSPDGKLSAFVIRKPGPDFLAWESSIHLLNTATKEVHQFTAMGKNCSSPAFSQDGKTLYFLTSRDYRNTAGKSVSGRTQIWVAPLTGGEAFPLTEIPYDVEEFFENQNGGTLAVLCSGEESEKPFMVAGKDIKSDEEIFPKIKPKKRLLVYALNPLQQSLSVELDAGAEKICISPDGSTVIYQSSVSGEYDDEDKIDLYSVNAQGKVTPFVNSYGPETSPMFSPDGKSVAFLSRTVPDIEFAEIDLNIIDVSGKERKILTDKFNFSVTSYVWKNSREIVFTAAEKTSVIAYLLNLQNSSINKISENGTCITNIAISKNEKILWRSETGTTLPELYYDGKRLTDYSKQITMFSTGSQEQIIYNSSDGKFELNGLLFTPSGFDKNKKYPLVVTIHGGPYGSFRNTFAQIYPIKILTSLGYVVFAPNPRGSLGGSDEFGQANRYDLGGGDYKDIIDGLDYLIGKGFIDEQKMGVMGGSYGGYLTNWAISQTTRFKAAVSMYGIFSFLTDWSNSWQPSFEKMYFGYYYWEKPIDMNNLYISRSPAFYAPKIKTPTLILQGEKDVYTDVANSREMYQALKTLGVPVEFVLYPGEGHGIRNKPYHFINVLNRTVTWFEKYLK